MLIVIQQNEPKLRFLMFIFLLEIWIICYQNRENTQYPLAQSGDSQNVVSRTLAWIPLKTFRNTNSFSHSRSSKSKIQSETQESCFNKYSRWFWYMQKFNMHINLWRMLLKGIFLFSRCGASLGFCISNNLPGDPIAADKGTKLLSTKTLEILREKTFISLLRTAGIL